MTDLSLALEAFHFLRPAWLLLLPAALWLALAARRAERGAGLRAEGVAPHLKAALTVGGAAARRLRPMDAAAVAVALAALGAAGPTWSRQPDPFAAQSAPAVVALAVTPSMQQTDLAPSRLERGKQKIRDFLELRAGARTALVAFAGAAHVVLPMTEDAGVMTPYLEGLSPDVMPSPGLAAADALTLAQTLLAAEDAPGVVLFVTDALDPADASALDGAEAAVAVLALLPEGARDRGLDALSAPVVRASPDGTDVARLDALLNAAFRRAQLDDLARPWEDRGVWLAWPAALLLLPLFRRGWVMRWLGVGIVALGLGAPGAARADGVADWFLTPDQQGRLAMQRNAFGDAADLFVDPMQRGYALYRAGRYEEAVSTLDRVETAEAAFIQGMAQLKSRAYRDGVRSFETALERDPDLPGAARNLEQARRIVDYVERVREQSDTGEESGIGADDTVYDNEAARGAETEVQYGEERLGDGPLSADQWMNTVETRTSDFLRLRFALEAARRPQAEAAE